MPVNGIVRSDLGGPHRDCNSINPCLWSPRRPRRGSGYVHRIPPLALIALVLLAAGCSHFTTEMGRPLPKALPDAASGPTTAAAVVLDLGPPNRIGALPDGFAFLYEYTKADEFQIGFSVDKGALRWLKFVHAWNRLDQQALLMAFDASGRLRSQGSARWRENLGGGDAVQFLIAAMSLADLSALEAPADAHRWGLAMLQAPPVALNDGQSLRTGAHGLQQRIAPVYAGQSALEMAPPPLLKAKKNRSHAARD